MGVNDKLFNKEYRPDINGLRAVAVILVLLYHLEISLFNAGFLGVDVFLVISGYLISRNILRDLQLNKFSFKNFYTRRLKRLFPALFFTLTISLLVGFYLLSPVNLERLGKSVLSGILSIANVFFLSEKGYFDLESEFKPLLHIWSLSLEEQFYFVWPLLLLVIFKFFRKHIFTIIFVIILGSLLASIIFNNEYSEAVFYLLPFRFFEFLLGAMCIWFERFTIKNKILLEFILLLGLLLIIYSAISFTVLTPMPGTLSLVPCIGAMMVIYAGKAKYSSWLLKNKLFEIIGKSSYSIYLVHWPIIVYYKYWNLTELTQFSKVIIGVVSLILGYLMWKYIENVFRNSTIRYKKIDAVWLWSPILVFLLSFFAINTWSNNGYPSRYSDEFTMSKEEILANRKNYWKDSNSNHAILGGTNDETLIVMGNSHAIDLIYALRTNGLKSNITSLQTSNRCYNFGSPRNKESVEHCASKKRKNLENPIWSEADAIYLHDNWPKLDLENLKKILMEIRKLSNAPIYVFGPKMTFSKNVPDIVHSCQSSFPNAINNYAQNFAKLDNRKNINNSLIEFFNNSFFKQESIFYVDVLDVLKNDKNKFDIISTKTSKFLYFDKSHYTEQGAQEFGEKLKYLKPFLFNLSEIKNEVKKSNSKTPKGNLDIINNSKKRLVKVSQKILTLKGWGLLEGENSKNTEISVALKKGVNFAYIIKPNKIKREVRQDVSKHFKVESMYDNSGFSTSINTDILEKGEYSIILLLKDKKGGIYEKIIKKKIEIL